MDVQKIKLDVNCYHCGDACMGQAIQFDEKNFCCEGCKTVYGILNQSDLCDYYSLNAAPGTSQRKRYRKDKFAFLELPEVQQKLIQFQDGEQAHLMLYLPQMHCSSCLWLLENIHHLNAGVVSSQVNFNQ